MKPAKDNFSVQSKGYSQFRPSYPQALYDEIFSHVATFGRCWDCATGNGQMAMVLAERFEAVEATDISPQQLDKAILHPKINYSISRAEVTHFEADSFELITVGQAIHWFDHDAFNEEVKRVSKNGGLIAVVGYGLMFVNDEFDRHLMQFYDGTIGKYWDPERKHIDSHYTSIPFPFEAIAPKKEHSIDVRWNLAQLAGYLSTWSSVNRFIKQNGFDPVAPFIQQLRETGTWTDDQEMDVHFPLFVKLGRIVK